MQLVIIGGGAAGFMAAITAAETNKNLSIVILEKNRTVLNKVRISGGGRCNVTHKPSEARFFAKNYPRGDRFLKKLFNQFSAEDTVAWFKQRGVELKTENDGRMFPVTDSSETIIQCLTRTAAQLGIEVRTSCNVESFSYASESNNEFILQLQDGEKLIANKLLIAAGGNPKRANYNWISDHQLAVNSPVPSLFTFNCPDSYLLPLSGVAVNEAIVKIAGTKYEWKGPLLITHWGFSGPAVLKLSAWGARELAELNYVFDCKINWIPAFNEGQVRELLLKEKDISPKQQIASHTKFDIPSRLWKAFVERAGISENLRWMEISNKLLNRLIDLLTNSQFSINGKSTYKEEFVTCGGVNLTELHPETLESTSVPGLYFAGEVIDVDGITGGFNFQNAWTTGFVTGKNIAKTSFS